MYYATANVVGTMKLLSLKFFNNLV
ncbi:hypothetical protein BAMTRB_054 [Escherichia phage vB_Eco_Bam]|uniref:Uncharacterized protein n=1 Tax=Escherichia phage vB_Eco_Bam TaxID=2898833 RepID=A0A9P0YDX5_9CAUD|nr:hypothetical protein BAMTRB_054 [Escherichia phage vB_Eco_Bam]